MVFAWFYKAYWQIFSYMVLKTENGMIVNMVILDGKGRLVIPRNMRKKLNIRKNENLFIYSFNDLIIMRKVDLEKNGFIETIDRLKGLGLLE